MKNTTTGPQTLAQAKARNAKLRAQVPNAPLGWQNRSYAHCGLGQPESEESRTLTHFIAENQTLERLIEPKLLAKLDGKQFDPYPDVTRARALIDLHTARAMDGPALAAFADQALAKSRVAIESEIAAKGGGAEITGEARSLLRAAAAAVFAVTNHANSMKRDLEQMAALGHSIAADTARLKAENRAKVEAALAAHRAAVAEGTRLIDRAAEDVKAKNARARAQVNIFLAQSGTNPSLWEQYMKPAQKAEKARALAAQDAEEVKAFVGPLQADIATRKTHIATLENYLKENSTL